MACENVLISLYDGEGKRLFSTNDVTSATWVRTLNNVGKATVEVPLCSHGFKDLDVFSIPDLGMLIESADRQGQPFTTDLETVWFIQKIRESHSDQEETLTMTFEDAISILDRRLLPYLSDPSPGGISRTFMDGQAAIEMSRMVSNAMGPLADPEYQIPGFTVAPVGFSSPTMKKATAFRRVMNILKQSAATSRFRGTPLYFDVVPTVTQSSVDLEFRVYKDFRGRDRRSETLRTTDPWVNLDYYEISYDQINYGIVSGAGRETDRLVGIATTPEATAGKYSMRQGFKFSVSRNRDVVDSEAQALVGNASGLISIRAQLLGDLRFRYSLGDRMLIEHKDIIIDAIISSVRTDLDDQVFTREITLQSLASSI